MKNNHVYLFFFFIFALLLFPVIGLTAFGRAGFKRLTGSVLIVAAFGRVARFHRFSGFLSVGVIFHPAATGWGPRRDEAKVQWCPTIDSSKARPHQTPPRPGKNRRR